MAGQRPPPVDRDVDGGLVAGVQHQHAGADQLVLAQGLALVDHLRQRRDEIVAGMGAALAAQRAQVPGELTARTHRVALRLLGRSQLVHLADVRRPPPQVVTVGLGHAEHLRDHRDRQRLATVGSRSNSPVPATASTSPSTICSTRGRRPSTNLGVKAFATSRRTRAWSGGSMSRMPLRIRRQKGSC